MLFCDRRKLTRYCQRMCSMTIKSMTPDGIKLKELLTKFLGRKPDYLGQNKTKLEVCFKYVIKDIDEDLLSVVQDFVQDHGFPQPSRVVYGRTTLYDEPLNKIEQGCGFHKYSTISLFFKETG